MNSNRENSTSTFGPQGVIEALLLRELHRRGGPVERLILKHICPSNRKGS